MVVSPRSRPRRAKKSPALIIGIVVAAVVLLAAVGGIIMVLNRDGDQPPPVSITPSQPVPPTDQPTDPPTPTRADRRAHHRRAAADARGDVGPAERRRGRPRQRDQPDPGAGWEVKKTGKGVAQLSDGKSVFLGQAIQVEPSTNPGQLCDAWHRKVAEGSSNGKFAEPKPIDLGTTKLEAATCIAQVTVSNGQGSTTILLFSLVSVRTERRSDGDRHGVFPPNVDTEQLNKDFSAMVNSMLRGQVNG